MDQAAKLVWIIEGDIGQKKFLWKPKEIELVEMVPFERRLDPSLTLPRDFSHRGADPVQEIVEALAEEGYIAKNTPNAQELVAIRYHLEDMRKLVFKP